MLQLKFHAPGGIPSFCTPSDTLYPAAGLNQSPSPASGILYEPWTAIPSVPGDWATVTEVRHRTIRNTRFFMGHPVMINI